MRAPLHGISVGARDPGRKTDAEQSTPLPSISLRRVSGVCACVLGELRPHGPWSHGKFMEWEYFIFLSYLEHTLMHCYLVRLALQDSGPLARYPAATR